MFILTYHNIVDDDIDDFDRKCNRLSTAEFAAQLERIRNRFKVVSLKEGLSSLSSAESTDALLAITFDDGYLGVLKNAAPILRSHGFPATVFIVTENLDPSAGKASLSDGIEIAFRLTAEVRLDVTWLNGEVLDLGSVQDRLRSMKRVKRHLKLMLDSERRAAKHRVMHSLNVTADAVRSYAENREKYHGLNIADIHALMGLGMSVGSHTRRHRTLSRVTDVDCRDEIVHSYKEIQTMFDLSWIPFAYPYGGTEHVGVLAPQIVREAGYSCGLTTIPGMNTNRTDRFLLHRVEFDNLPGNTPGG